MKPDLASVRPAAMRPAALHHHVQVVIGQSRLGRKGHPSGYAQVALMLEAARNEGLDCGTGVAVRSDHDIHVDDRLGREAGDRCAADVLDPNGNVTDQRRQPQADGFALGRPVLVVGHDLGGWDWREAHTVSAVRSWSA